MKHLIIVVLLLTGWLCKGQNTFPASGNVGIGTSSPSALLQINSAVARQSLRIYTNGNTSNYLNIWQGTGGAVLDPIGTGLLYLGYDQSTNVIMGVTGSGANGGNVGIGTTTPSKKLEVAGDALANTYYLRNAWNSARLYGNGETVEYWSSTYHAFYAATNTTSPAMFINARSGQVGIGTTSPDAMLTVSGQVHAQEVKVTVAAPGPDYVFEKNYALPTLEQIKTFIDANKHLPEVPSAKEMEKEGVKLGEMNMILLKKVEELTLYILEQEKRIKALEKR